ncbi:MAG: NAD-dependent epimerase/dehydratase family protein [Algisphaera sp.]
MKHLITGGGGFIGSNLVRALQEHDPDAQLLVVDDFRSGTFANLSRENLNGVESWSYRGDVVAGSLHEIDLDALLDDFAPDTVFHLASITDTTVTDQAVMLRDNVEPFRNLLRWATDQPQSRKLVWASSAATYGTTANGATPAQRPFKLQDAGHPANVYGFSKWVMENLHCQAQHANPSAHLVGLRYFNVFGPGEEHKAHMASMIYQLAQKMIQGQAPRLFSPGDQARDHIHVSDVVGCTRAAAQSIAQSGIYNVGTGVATTFNAIVDTLNAALNTTQPTDYFNNPHAFYQNYTCADLAQTTACLGWTPQLPTLQAIHDYAVELKGQHV